MTAILVVGLALRLWDLGRYAFWLDEAMEYWVASVGLKDLLPTVITALQDPPLYSAFLHFWMLLGQNESTLRLPSVVFSMLAMLAIIRIAYRVDGWMAALIAGGSAAIAPINLRYAQEVGQYALITALICWNIVALQEIAINGRRRYYLLWLVTALLGIYTYYGSIIIVTVSLACYLAEKILTHDWRNWQSDLLISCAYLAAFLPLVIYFLPQQLFRGNTRLAFNLTLAPLLTELLSGLRATQEVLAFYWAGWPWSPLPAWLPAALVAVTLGFALGFCVTRVQRRLLAWLFINWATYFLLGKLNLFPYTYRYSIILIPLLFPAIAMGLAATLRRKYLMVASLAIIGALFTIAIISLPNYAWRAFFFPDNRWDWPEGRPAYRTLISEWENQRQERDLTLVYYRITPTFAYYWGKLGGPVANLSPSWFVTCWNRSRPGGECIQDHVILQNSLRDMDGERKKQAILASIPPRTKTLWLLMMYIHDQDEAIYLDALGNDFQIVSEKRINQDILIKFVRK